MRGFSTVVAVALVGIISTVSANADPKYVGCFEEAGNMKLETTDANNSRGKCADICKTASEDGYATMAMTKGKECWCGQTLPNMKLAVDTLLVDQSKCKQPCPGFGSESCGERLGKYFSVYTTGLEERPEEDPLPSSTSSTSSKTSTSASSSAEEEEKTSAAVSSAPASAETSAEPDNKEEDTGGVNKAAVAAGCVIAVLAIIGISIGAFLVMRKRRRAKVEEDFRRSAAVREFSQKPASDHRLDPGMVQKRDSVGSIADNQDYSRRILKVTNPDGN